MRIALAKLLLQNPSLIILDEPTNHLDIRSQNWVENYLKNYQGALIVISHDRAFLDTVTNKTYELKLGALNIYKGNYSFFLEQVKSNSMYFEGSQISKKKFERSKTSSTNLGPMLKKRASYKVELSSLIKWTS